MDLGDDGRWNEVRVSRGGWLLWLTVADLNAFFAHYHLIILIVALPSSTRMMISVPQIGKVTRNFTSFRLATSLVRPRCPQSMVSGTCSIRERGREFRYQHALVHTFR